MQIQASSFTTPEEGKIVTDVVEFSRTTVLEKYTQCCLKNIRRAAVRQMEKLC